ncbi:LysR family transcriptional regulator [Bacilliculturomica massiliensis]|uniref:LysR family transcriptional regulator n=1 Tax=Bacilliculturomica massiliensis TaxID=1917867 RepID=UPI001031FCF2|nr:LysR family transcriptional regulator [Bacilliculturomica massiliensis]
MESEICRDNLSINFESYKVFYLVASRSSMTLAAEALYLTQPAVSKSIHHLEEAFGCPLFLRTQKGMVLTEEGRELYHYIAQAYENIIKGQKRVCQMMNMEAGSIRVGTDEMTVHFDLLPRLERFNSEYPKIKMDISSYRRQELLRAIREGEIDFGVVMCQNENFEGFDIIQLNQVQYSFIVGRQYEYMRERTWTLAHILEYPIISLVSDMSARKHLDEFFTEQGLEFEPDIELTTTTLIVPFAERNLGVGIVARNFAEDSIRAGRIFELQVKPPLPQQTTCILIDKKNTISMAARRFLSQFDNKNRNEK